MFKKRESNNDDKHDHGQDRKSIENNQKSITNQSIYIIYIYIYVSTYVYKEKGNIYIYKMYIQKYKNIENVKVYGTI